MFVLFRMVERTPMAVAACPPASRWAWRRSTRVPGTPAA